MNKHILLEDFGRIIAVTKDDKRQPIGKVKDGALYISDYNIFAPYIPLSPRELRLIADMIEQQMKQN